MNQSSDPVSAMLRNGQNNFILFVPLYYIFNMQIIYILTPARFQTLKQICAYQTRHGTVLVHGKYHANPFTLK